MPESKAQQLLKHFDDLHKMSVPPLNPDYDPNAKEWSTMATYDMLINGFYKSIESKEKRAKIWRKFYDQRKAKGAVGSKELKKAQKYISDYDEY